MPLCPEIPLGGADMAVDSRARWEDFHTVPAHVSAAPEIESMRFSLSKNTISDLVQWTCRHPPAFSMGAWCETFYDHETSVKDMIMMRMMKEMPRR